MRLTRKELTHPLALGILAGVGFTTFLLVQAAIWGFNLAEFAILVGVCIVANAVGIYISREITKGFSERSKR